jgi:hypothetical protein
MSTVSIDVLCECIFPYFVNGRNIWKVMLLSKFINGYIINNKIHIRYFKYIINNTLINIKLSIMIYIKHNVILTSYGIYKIYRESIKIDNDHEISEIKYYIVDNDKELSYVGMIVYDKNGDSMIKSIVSYNNTNYYYNIFKYLTKDIKINRYRNYTNIKQASSSMICDHIYDKYGILISNCSTLIEYMGIEYIFNDMCPIFIKFIKYSNDIKISPNIKYSDNDLIDIRTMTRLDYSIYHQTQFPKYINQVVRKMRLYMCFNQFDILSKKGKEDNILLLSQTKFDKYII